MAQYLLLFIGRQADYDPDDRETLEYNAKWGEWMKDLADSGALVSGSPLAPEGREVTADGVSDLDVDTIDLGGFVVIEAESEEEALEVAGSTPHIARAVAKNSPHARTIVRPCVQPD
ncbi:YciI family protein [Saccharothrix sp. BKS2]|uniref:YciI family protein n=1 Tax=Saccharothrix sp. BKS2 TaxID=3064400 RepID=UPI0039E9C241